MALAISTMVMLLAIALILLGGTGAWLWWCSSKGVPCNPISAFTGYPDEQSPSASSE